MPLQATSGAATYDAFGGGVPVAPNYIEDVFSTWLYTGTGATLTITNGIDLSGKGGLVWFKDRNHAGENNRLFDTVRGTNKVLYSNTTNQQITSADITSYNATGFTLPGSSNVNVDPTNPDPHNYVSWTFREQPKFFDVVTYTGNGTAGRQISHSLGSTPGCIIVKNTSSPGYNWAVYHRSLTSNQYALQLNNTAAQLFKTAYWNSTTPTSTVFTLGDDADVNESGQVYIAYLFAHNAGGFGLTGTDNVISCGSYTGNGSTTGPLINLGWEPQWLLVKQSSISGAGWYLIDTMRGATSSGTDAVLFANTSGAETSDSRIAINATGFQPIQAGGELNASGETCIYIAIRRGPMKTPTTGTSVFAPQVYSSGSSPAFGGLSFPPDAAIQLYKPGGAAAEGPILGSKLQGAVKIQTSSSVAEASEPDFVFYQNGFRAGSANSNYAAEMFRRAPGFFDVLCYTGGTGTPRVLNHNLAVAPELLITRVRNFTGEDWVVHYNNGSSIIGGYLNSTSAFANSSTAPSTDVTSFTATTYTLNTSNRRVNGAYNYVAYLFASCPGVSKVGSYTGTGALQTINCGFTGGARFVLIKRTDSTGDWWVYDSARGITSGNDPYLFLNSTAAEVTSTNYVDTDTTGFKVTAAAPAGLNANGGSYIFLAIA